MAGLALELVWKPAARVLTCSSVPPSAVTRSQLLPPGGQDSSALAGEPSALCCPAGGRGRHGL